MAPTVALTLARRTRRMFWTGLAAGVLFLGTSLRASAAAWPFDQRNILLAKMSQKEFPDDLTVAQILDVFVKKGRVRWVMQKGGKGEIIPVEIPVDFQWQSSVSVRRLGLRYQVDGIVLLQKKGTEVELRWYGVSDGEPLFFEKVNLPEAGVRKEDEEARRKRLTEFLEDIWLRIPGRGYVVKRDFSTLTFEGAAQAGTKVGDTLEIRRLERAERHPLLKTLIGIRSTVSGRAQVTAIGEPFSTAKIDYESQTDPIQEGDRYDILTPAAISEKAAAVEAKTPSAGHRETPGKRGKKAKKAKKDKDEESSDDKDASDETTKAEAPKPSESSKDDGDDEKKVASASDDSEDDEADDESDDGETRPAIAEISGRMGWSSFDHSESLASGSKDISGHGPGFDFDAKGFVSRQWIVAARFGFRQFSPSDLESVYGSKIGGSILNYRIGGAYRIVFMENEKPTPGEFAFGLGYQRFGFSVTQLSTDIAPVGKVYTGFDFSISLKVPVWGKFSAFAEGSRIMGATLTETPLTTGNPTGAVVWGFSVGGNYHFDDRSIIALSIDSASASSNFTGTGDRTEPAISNVISTSGYFVSYVRKF